jgi:hypothetical protein
MKKSYLITIIVFVVVLAAAAAADLIIKQRETQKTPAGEEQNVVDVSVVSISEKDSFYNIQVEYPQFKEADEAFNKKISDLVTGEIATFKKDSKDNYEARRATAPTSTPLPENPATPFDFIASWTPAQLNNNYLSFVINIYYFSGGAHGLTEVDAFDYDLTKKKEIAITDFLNSPDQSLQKLANLAKQAVTIEVQSTGIEMNDSITQMIDQGTAPTADNYKNFSFNSDSITIYFQQYQVAPGYIGPIPITLFKNMLNDSSISTNYLK